MDSNLIFTILGVILFWVVVYVAGKALLKMLVKKWPILIYVIGIGVGIGLWIGWHWIAGIIGGFITLGILGNLLTSGTVKCLHCGSYDTECTQSENVNGRVVSTWKCNKCGHVSGYY